MATINYSGNTYSGEVLEDLLVYTAVGNDTYREGLIHVKSGIQKKFTLPHVSLGKIIQDNVPTPTSTNGGTDGGKNDYNFSERYLEPQDFMVYLEFNPRDFETYWKPFQPDGNLVFRNLDPKVQSTMLRLLIDRKDQYIGDCIWASRKGGSDTSKYESDSATNTVLGGDSEAGPMKYFDGFIMRVINNLTSTDANEIATGRVIHAGSTVLDTGEKVESALYTMYQKCPKALRKSNDLKFVMGWELWDLYDQYLSSKGDKYTENPDVNRFKFKGKRICVINGITEQTIVLGKFTTDMNSVLWMGVDYATDEESVKVERLQANSELYFFQMRMKMDVNIVKPSEIVVWTTYHKILTALATPTLAVSSTDVNITCTDDAKVDHYAWTKDDGTNWTDLAAGVKKVECAGLTAGTYSIKVKAVAKSGDYNYKTSEKSSAASITIS